MPDYNKVTVSTGQRKRNNHLNLGGFQANTTDFGTTKVLSCDLLYPGDKVSAHLTHVMQMTPLVGHTIGKCSMNFRSFFVPCRLAYKYFEEFQTHKTVPTADGSITPSLPMVNNLHLSMMFSDVRHIGFRVGSQSSNAYAAKQSSPWSQTGEPRYYNWLDSDFVEEQCLTEVVGVCRGFSDDGKPIDVCHIQSNGEFPYYVDADRLNMNNGVYDGKDYDIIMPISKWNGGDSYSFQVYSWMSGDMPFYDSLETAIDNGSPVAKLGFNGDDSTPPYHPYYRCYPYVLLKFTKLGKRIYDLFQVMGYGVQFTCFPYVLDDDGSAEYLIENGSQNYSLKLAYFPTNTAKWEIGFENFPAHDYRLERVGNVFYQAVCSCGSSDVENGYLDMTNINLMRLYSLFKVYLDYLCPNYYYDIFNHLISKHFYGYTFLNGDPDYEEFIRILRFVLTCNYDKDYFTSAWQHPNQPTDRVSSFAMSVYDTTLINEENEGTHTVFSAEDTTALSQNDDPTTILTKTGLDLVSALHKLARVTGLAGNRYIDQLFARFGVKNPNARLQRSEEFDSFRSRFDIETVISNASTADASLGDYTAHGHSENGGSLGHGEITEFGFFIVICQVMPLACYYQGRLRENFYDNYLDFFQPEIDAVDGMQAIRMDELYSDNKVGPCYYNAHDIYKPNSTFGYTRLWAEGKKGRDYLGGDFRLDSRGKYTNNAYHLFRDIPTLSEMTNSNMSLTNDLQFQIGFDANQYARVFQLLDGDFDHFYLFMNLDILVTRNNKSMTDFSSDDECEKLDRTIKNGGTEL